MRARHGRYANAAAVAATSTLPLLLLSPLSGSHTQKSACGGPVLMIHTWTGRLRLDGAPTAAIAPRTYVHAKPDRRVATKPHVVFPGPAPAAASKRSTAPPPHQTCRCCCRWRAPRRGVCAGRVCVRKSYEPQSRALLSAPACFPTAFWPKGGTCVLRASRLRRAPNS